jgi:GT2 family glycosyltransferase
MKLSVLITCHNRRDKTLRCLDSVCVQSTAEILRPDVWLVDDGSTDGTDRAVSILFPAVRRISGTGELFWCGGMRKAWALAAAEKPDAFLWLNDDVVLSHEALAALMLIARRSPRAIIVGSCASEGRRTYGGLRRAGGHPGRVEPVEPGPAPKPCDTFEGNIVWIPASAHAVLGNMEPFKHAMADVDYGYRASKAGIPVVLAPGFLGECSANASSGTWRDRSLSRLRRLHSLLGIKGLPPADWWKFCRAHGGARAPFYFAGPFLRILCGL